MAPDLTGLASVPPLRPLRGLLDHLLEVVFPARCVICQRLGSDFCPDCRAQVRPVPQPVCRRCGRPVAGGARCAECQAGTFTVSAIRAPGLYAFPLSRAIRRFKYHGQTGLKRPLGAMIAQYWQGRSVTTDLVAAVPLHEARLRERGYNQAWLLAEEFCRTTGLPLLRDGWLHRRRNTPQQVLLGLADRQRNVSGAFAWDGPSLQGLKVLLIDDVATSGSTLEACGQALAGAGADKVWALTVARAVGSSAMSKPRSG